MNIENILKEIIPNYNPEIHNDDYVLKTYQTVTHKFTGTNEEIINFIRTTPYSVNIINRIQVGNKYQVEYLKDLTYTIKDLKEEILKLSDKINIKV